MSEQFVPPRYAHITFCEDIRQEVGGQVSEIGVFRSHFVRVPHKPPIVVPQVVCSVQIIGPKNDPFTSVKVTVLWRDQVLQELDAPDHVLKDPRAHNGDPEAKRYMMTIDIKAGPIVVDADGDLKATVEVNGELLNYGALRFRFDSRSS